MTDHPSNLSDRTDQGGSSPAAPGSPNDKGTAEIAPDTAAGEQDKRTEETEDKSEDGNAEEQAEIEEEEQEDIEEGEEEDDEEDDEEEEEASAPPLPDEVPPPLPNEAPPGEDDGWEPVWDANAQAYYFYNRFTGVAQWENPRVPDPSAPGPPSGDGDQQQQPQKKASPVAGGYNPAIHGDYDPTAPYAQQYEEPGDASAAAAAVGALGMGPGYPYEATGAFNRFTGKWQADSLRPENYTDENKARRQMSAFFDVDAAANSHDGRSLRAERSAKKLSKKELKMFKNKRRDKKEEKRRAWLRD